MARMRRSTDEDGIGQILIIEIVRSAMILEGIVDSLLEELSEDAFSGEEPAIVLLEMMAGSARPAIEAAGEDQCQAAITLMGAVVDRVMADLKEAVRLSEGKG